MKTNQFFKLTKTGLVIALISAFASCNGNDDDGNGTTGDETTDEIPLNSKYTVSAEITNDTTEDYFVTTDNITSGEITIVGEGYEGAANLAVSLDGYFYDINDLETTIDKYEFTDDGLEKVDAISYGAIFPDLTLRYIQSTGTGDILISSNPRGGEAPYLIIDLEDFTLEKSGYVTFPEVDGQTIGWTNPHVKDCLLYTSPSPRDS